MQKSRPEVRNYVLGDTVFHVNLGRGIFEGYWGGMASREAVVRFDLTPGGQAEKVSMGLLYKPGVVTPVDLVGALEEAIELLNMEECPDDGGKQDESYAEAARRIRAMAQRIRCR